MLDFAISLIVVTPVADSKHSIYFPPHAENAVLDLTLLLNCLELEAALAILTSESWWLSLSAFSANSPELLFTR